MIKKILTILFLMFFLGSCSLIPSKKNVKILQQDEEGYVDFKQAIKSGKIVIAKFGLDICTGCIEANKIIVSLIPMYGQYQSVYFSKVDLMKDREAEKKYKITMMPTIIFFDKKGIEFDRIEGKVDSMLLIDKIEDFFYK